MKSERRVGPVLIAGGIFMLAAAFLLVGYNLYDEYRAGVSAHHVVETLEQQIPTPSIPETELPDYIVNPDMEMPTLEIENNEYIGVLEIPSLKLILPVMNEWSYPKLKIAPCCYSGSAYTGNLVIAGHNYHTCFGTIEKLIAGAQIIFTDIKGRSFVYEVAAVEILTDTAVEEMLSTEWDLTLFTCTTGGQARVTVRCIKLE